jgi:hypothetical protein
MTVTVNTATRRQVDVSGGNTGDANQERILVATVELAASDSSSTISFGKIPSNARILAASKVYWDDLATSGSPTLDLGLKAVNANVTTDDDCLNDGLALSAVSTANVGAFVVKDIANVGLPAWDYVANVTADPGGLLEVLGTVRDAATTATGTVTLELHYIPG